MMFRPCTKIKCIRFDLQKSIQQVSLMCEIMEISLTKGEIKQFEIKKFSCAATTDIFQSTDVK